MERLLEMSSEINLERQVESLTSGSEEVKLQVREDSDVSGGFSEVGPQEHSWPRGRPGVELHMKALMPG